MSSGDTALDSAQPAPEPCRKEAHMCLSGRGRAGAAFEPHRWVCSQEKGASKEAASFQRTIGIDKRQQKSEETKLHEMVQKLHWIHRPGHFESKPSYASCSRNLDFNANGTLFFGSEIKEWPFPMGVLGTRLRAAPYAP